MERIIHIEGMGCSGCENRVKKALEALSQVAQAQVSKDTKTAVVTMNEALTDAILEETASCGGKYTITGIE